MRGTVLGIAIGVATLVVLATLLAPAAEAYHPTTGAIFTTLEDGSRVNANIYSDKRDVYLDGGPGPNAPQSAAGLHDGNYYFQVTDPSGKTLLSEDPVICREFRVADGIIVEYVSAGRTYIKGNPNNPIPCYQDGWQYGKHDTGVDIDHGAITIQLMPYEDTPNKGGVYKAWATPTVHFDGDPNKVDNSCGTGCFHGFVPRYSKTDNFKVRQGRPFDNPQINVLKFIDTDGDGVWDDGEPQVGVDTFIDGGGWPVSVMDPNEVASNGYTPYTYLPGFAGTYYVTEEVLDGWAQTAAYLDDVSQPVDPTVAVGVAFTSGERHTVIFGNFECLTVSGYKVNDLNGNGDWDQGEPTIAGWTIELYRNGVLVATTQTDANGFYSFTICGGGDYTVQEVVPDGWTATSDVSFSFTAASGADQSGNFLNFECFTVSGYKVNDLNGNGVWDDGETTVAGWTIELYRNGVLYATTTTNANGFYSFTVCEGGEYEVREGSASGWVATGPTSFSFSGTSGQDQSLDFTNFELGSICGSKFYDFDHDGTWDASEGGIEGWKIELLLNGAVVATAYTDVDGNYCFNDLGPGDYTVQEVMPSNPNATSVWAQTFPTGDGQWHVTVTSGLDFEDADFGNVCEFTESRTWGYWKTHTGFDGPERDATYDELPANPLDIDVTTPDGDDLVETDYEANWVFDGAGTGESPNCSGTCRSLFRAQLLALHMSLLKFDGMGDAVYQYAGDAYSGMTVQAIHDAAVSLLNSADPAYDFASFQQTLDRINNNHNQSTGSHVLVCATAPDPVY